VAKDKYRGTVNYAGVGQQCVDTAPFAEDGAEGGGLGYIGGYICLEERCVGAEAEGCDGSDQLAGRSLDRLVGAFSDCHIPMSVPASWLMSNRATRQPFLIRRVARAVPIPDYRSLLALVQLQVWNTRATEQDSREGVTYASPRDNGDFSNILCECTHSWNLGAFVS